jgi:hypothetical protein
MAYCHVNGNSFASRQVSFQLDGAARPHEPAVNSQTIRSPSSFVTLASVIMRLVVTQRDLEKPAQQSPLTATYLTGTFD